MPHNLALVALCLSFVCTPARTFAQTLEVVHRFDWQTAPDAPRAALLEASDGHFYGTTQRGGTFNQGTLFRLTRNGALTVLHSFAGGDDGQSPVARLAQGTDGSVYGVTQFGGSRYAGTAFRLAPDGTYNTLHTFGGAGDVLNPPLLIAASDGRFYGLGVVGSNWAVFQMNASGDTAILATFASTATPQTLIEATDGNLYGPTRGSGGVGDSVFRLTTAGTYSTVVSRSASSDGAGFTNQFMQGRDGNFYGATSRGSTTPGTIVSLTPSGTLTTLATIDALVPYATSGYTVSGLVQAPDTTLYMTIIAPNNSANPGLLLSLSPTGTLALLRNLGNSCQASGVTLTADTSLVLTIPAFACSLGGDGGAIVTADTNGVASTLYRFLRTNDWPAVRSALVEHPNGAVYGAACNAGTASGDPYQSGMVFRVLQPSGIAVVHEFESTPEGLCPGGLTVGDNGYLYGTTKFGGSQGGGTAFRLSPSGDLVVLHSFVPGTEGRAPEAPLVYSSDGNFYGATTSGGANAVGTVFRMTPGGTVTVLHAFAGTSDGGGTTYAMIQARDGNIYGTTTSSAFKLTLSGTFSVLSRLSDGAVSGLVEGDDAFYGLAKVNYFLSPQTKGYSVYLYRVSPSGDFRRFPNSLGGVSQGLSLAGAGEFTLSAAAAGRFMATASTYFYSGAGNSANSSVYLASPSGTLELLGQLDPRLGPIATPLVRATDGNFYGGTSGLLISGVLPLSAGVFRFTPARLAPTVTISMTGPYVRLTWTPVAGALSYTIWRVAASGAEMVTSVTGNQFVDAGVEQGQHYRYVVTASTVFGVSVASNDVAATPGRWTPGDFDGDHRADVAIYRPSRGAWYSRNSTVGYVIGAGNWQFEWGAPGDITIEADFDGDGILDPTVYRPSAGQWFILYSTRAYNPDQFGFFEWGTTGDVPITADFDGDNKADVGVYRPATGYWYIRHSSTGYPVGSGNWIFQWGTPGDIPEVGDFDGDGHADIAVYRPSTGQWFIRTSSTQFDPLRYWYIQWGTSSDRPMVADFDGDGKTDVGVYRPSTGYWYLRLSAQGWSEFAGNWVFQWGATGDEPRAIDLDGDGAADIAVYRPTTGQWFIRYSSRAYNASLFGYFQWGATGDLALP